MKRPAIGFRLSLSVLSILLSVSGAGVVHAKGGKGGAAKAEAAPAAAEAPADQAAADEGAAADPNAAPAADPNAAPAPETVTPEGEENPAAAGEISPEAGKAKAPTTISWQDIVVVPRKAFLKGGRVEFAPFTGLTLNDNLIRHYVFGGDINFFLSDVFWVGVQGQYFVKNFTPTEENVGLQYNRIPTLNRYLYGGSLNFGYVPVYGKFSWFNKQIMHWEIYASAGFGITVTEIIPRNPGQASFKNNALTPNAGLGARFFLFNWLTVNFALRDYIMADKFEPTMRDPNWDAATTKANADNAWVNNLMFYGGVGIYLPAKFSYKTPR
jgi:outer membrane beta-barrel protein